MTNLSSRNILITMFNLSSFLLQFPKALYAIIIGACALLLSNCSNVKPYTNDLGALGGTPLREFFVKTPDEFKKVSASLQAGDVIILANGEWRNVDLVFQGNGTIVSPIYLIAENPGKVLLTGQSSLRLGGKYLVVSGLVFRDGYTPRREVISFRVDSKKLAFNSRVTQTVIENYNNPDRTQRDAWVVMYGQNNEFDHNHLSGKLNSGPTFVVRLNTEESQKNKHHIHHNYFGPRPVFGSNGGETLRIGTSHYSMTRSETLVEYNFFDRCSGEVEIISNKSGGNMYRYNTFYKSRGTLTLRHGNDTVVENNYFEGANAPYTGGVRVINARQTVRNNHFANLTGERFSGALVIMNGVPNSPINRYHQVDGAIVENNIFENISRVELGEGSDSERSAVPINSVFRNNTVAVAKQDDSPFRLYDDMNGIQFVENETDRQPPTEIAYGFTIRDIDLQTSASQSRDNEVYGVRKEKTGVSWYPKPDEDNLFDSGKTINVEPGENQIAEAMTNASYGDILILAPGHYNEPQTIDIKFPVTIKSQDPLSASLSFERRNLFLLSSNGSIKIENVQVTGERSPDASGNSVIASTAMGGSGNHTVKIINSKLTDFVVNRGFSIVSATKGTFFDKVLIQGTEISNVSGIPFKFDTESDDFGIYNVEYLKIRNSKFKDIRMEVANVYRGGRDESTFGPHIIVTDSEFETVGRSGEPLFNLHGAQYIKFKNNKAVNIQPVLHTITTGKPKVTSDINVVEGKRSENFIETKDLRR